MARVVLIRARNGDSMRGACSQKQVFQVLISRLALTRSFGAVFFPRYSSAFAEQFLMPVIAAGGIPFVLLSLLPYPLGGACCSLSPFHLLWPLRGEGLFPSSHCRHWMGGGVVPLLPPPCTPSLSLPLGRGGPGIFSIAPPPTPTAVAAEGGDTPSCSCHQRGWPTTKSFTTS